MCVLHERFLVFTVVSVGVHKSVHSRVIGTISSGGEVIITELVESVDSTSLSEEFSTCPVFQRREVSLKVREVARAGIDGEDTSSDTFFLKIKKEH